MNDMSQVIIPRSDQLNADDMISGPMTVTISDVRITPGSEQPVSIVLEGTDKFYRPCKSMSRVLVGAWGADAKAYIGRSLTLYRDPEVKWGGMAVGGIRISHMSDIDGAKVMVLTATKGSRKPHKVLPIENATAPKPTEDKALAWADKLIATINTSAPEEVAALTAKHAATLEKMKAERPELYERVIAATVPVESDPFAEDEPSPAQKAAAAYIADFGQADDIAAIETLWTKSAPDRTAMPDALSASVEAAYEAAKARVSEGAVA